MKAVDGVSFGVARGDMLGLVGESGSGKSVTGYSIIGLVDPPGRIAAGEVLLNGGDLDGLQSDALRRVRGRSIAMVFQDPMMTLNPVLKIVDADDRGGARRTTTSREGRARPRSRRARIVGIPSPEERLDTYPHQLSGGMRQRVAIAIALLHKPAVIIADEPTTALDVSIQGQILAEVRRSRRDRHGVRVGHARPGGGRRPRDDICVMYAGRVVENGAGGGCDRIAAPSLHARSARLRAGRARAGRDAAAGPGIGAVAR